MSEWFEEWFDSHYYHLLYQHRDADEAKAIIMRLIDHLAPSPDAKMLDLACGKGRHTRVLAEAGYDVTGVDLSPSSIEAAKEYETDRLRFGIHDMREVYQPAEYDYIFNFFTSFGYFPNEEDHCRAIESIAHGLNTGGIFLIDYLNSPYIAANLVASNQVVKQGVEFRMERNLIGGYFIKDIWIEDGNRNLHYQEQVRAFDFHDLALMITDAGMEIIDCFGDYELNPYEEESSSRLIITARKS